MLRSKSFLVRLRMVSRSVFPQRTTNITTLFLFQSRPNRIWSEAHLSASFDTESEGAKIHAAAACQELNKEWQRARGVLRLADPC